MILKVLWCPILLLLVFANPCSASDSVDRPNIVLFLADDLGWTGLSCFGSDLYETPHLDAMAKSGVKFTNAYSACTVCSPTRASVMTGMYPARLHLTDFIAGQNRPFAKMRIPDWTKQLETRHITIAEALKETDYRTAHIGKWHLNAKGNGAKGTMPTDQGFDVSFAGPPRKGYFLKDGTKSSLGTNYLTDVLTDRACKFIENSKDQHFFLYFAYNVPHTPIQGREDLVDLFQTKLDHASKKKPPVHNNPTYAAMVRSMDQSVGRVLKSLENNGVADNTLVIFISDNGGLTQRYGKHDGFTENLPLRRGKGSAYEGGVRVPMITHWPKGKAKGQICETPVMTIDLFPTLLEVALMDGVSAEVGLDGRNLMPLIDGSGNLKPRDLFWHYPHYHAGGDWPYSAIRSGAHRLVQNLEDNSVQLFDLKNDIGEQTNLAEQNPQRTAQLLGRLNEWRKSVDAQMPTINPDYDPDRATEVKRSKR